MSTRLLLSSCAIALTGIWFDGSMRPVALVIDVAIILGVGIYFMIEKLNASEENLSEVVSDQVTLTQ